MTTAVVNNDVDKGIAQANGFTVHDTRSGGAVPAGAVYLGAAGAKAPSGSQVLEGAGRQQTQQLAAAYNATAAANASSGSDLLAQQNAATTAATQQSAISILTNQFTTWGIPELIGTATQLIQSGLSQDAVSVQLQNSDAYKTRFAGNTQRTANGFGVLSPADYISTEDAYKQVLSQYGLPAGFYDTQDALANWIGQDVSPTEVQTRAQQASDLVNNSDPTARNLLQQYYGVDSGHLIATFLDPAQAQPHLDKMAYAANVGAAAQRYNVPLDQGQVEGLYGTATQDQATSGLQQAGAVLPQEGVLAQRYGQTYSAQDAVNEFVLGQQAPADKQKMINQLESGQFSQGPGFSRGVSGSPGGF